MLRFFKFLCIFFSISSFASVNFSTPSTTQSDLGTPNLSTFTANSFGSLNPQITNANGQYVYAIWQLFDPIAGFNYIQVGRSSNFGKDWVNPISTPPGTTTPNLTSATNGSVPQITTDETGKYVYEIWIKDFNLFTTVQVALSWDFGQTWVYPTSTPSDLNTPNLSDSGGATAGVESPQITTSSDGSIVYAIWKWSLSGSEFIQVAISSDYGQTWVYPTSTPSDQGTPNLSNTVASGASGNQITTSSSGEFVYASWSWNPGAGTFVQVAISSDFGQTWVYPTTTPPNTSSPNLSESGSDSYNNQMATDESGKYVYVVWQRGTFSGDMVQLVISLDYGNTWGNPITTQSDLPSPYISLSGANNGKPQIAISSNGQYVYVVWSRTDPVRVAQFTYSSDYGQNWSIANSTPAGSNTFTLSNNPTPGDNVDFQDIATSANGQFIYVVWRLEGIANSQISISNDFGKNWEDPTNVFYPPPFPPVTPPNLSETGSIGTENTHVSTNSGGKYVYVTWSYVDGISTGAQTIQAVNGINNFAQKSTLFGEQKQISSLLQTQLINKIHWNLDPNAVKYLIYTDAALTNLIGVVYPQNTSFVQNQVVSGETNTYYVTWMDMNGNETAPSIISLP